jgi:plastocyanin
MKRVVWTGIVAAFLAIAVCAVAVIFRENVGSARPAAGATVVMAKLAYSPAKLTVRRGTTVVFDNQDVAPHTVTADDAPIDSGLIAPGKAFEVVVHEGFTYHCNVHPSMKAEIEMEA